MVAGWGRGAIRAGVEAGARATDEELALVERDGLAVSFERNHHLLVPRRTAPRRALVPVALAEAEEALVLVAGDGGEVDGVVPAAAGGREGGGCVGGAVGGEASEEACVGEEDCGCRVAVDSCCAREYLLTYLPTYLPTYLLVLTYLPTYLLQGHALSPPCSSSSESGEPNATRMSWRDGSSLSFK